MDNDNSRLRSEKVRKLTEEIPPSIFRIGIAVIVIVSVALLSAVIFIPNPYGNGESILRHLLGTCLCVFIV